jgi:hypothetical protein
MSIAEMTKPTRRKRLIYLFFAVLAFLGTNWIWPFVWFALPIHGQVIDHSTQQPIPNAIVSAIWELRGGPERTHSGALFATETRTDASGHFTVPAWGPRFNLGWGSIYDDQPLIAVFQPGYLPLTANRHTPRFQRLTIMRDAPYLLDLERPQDQEKYQASMAGLAFHLLEELQNADHCYWGSIKTTVTELQQASTTIRGTPAGSLFGPVALNPPACTIMRRSFGVGL